MICAAQIIKNVLLMWSFTRAIRDGVRKSILENLFHLVTRYRWACLCTLGALSGRPKDDNNVLGILLRLLPGVGVSIASYVL